MSVNVIGLVGVIGAGKSTYTEGLLSKGFIEIAFADELRSMVYSIIGYYPETKQEYEKFKVTKFKNGIFGDIQFTGRDLLERIGEEIRKRNVEFFIDPLQSKIVKYKWSDYNKHYDVVVSDIRYKNEYQAVKDFDGLILFCNYKNPKYDANRQHESQRLAQYLISRGLKHGKEVTPDMIEDFMDEN